MPSLKEVVDSLNVFYRLIGRANNDLQDILQSNMPQSQKDDIQTDIQKQLIGYEAKKMAILESLITFPPFHDRHFQKLTEFHSVASYDKSVFIMTKFPEGNTPLDAELQAVIDAVKEAVAESNFIPRIASEKKYYPGLWDNVEVYLVGCKKAIAIVESKYKDELNPNVMMEWGWMRGMGRDVLYLVEDSFNLARADISGLLTEKFTWNDPTQDIKKAVKSWLTS